MNGDIIAFLDADDFWLPGKLEAQMREVKKGATFVATSYRFDNSKTIVDPASNIDKPEDVGQLPDGITKNDEQNLTESDGEDWTLKQLLNDRNFWVLSFVFALQFCAMMAVLAHITFYASERGWVEQARGKRNC